MDGGTNNEHLNTGCTIRSAIKGIHQLGCPPDSVWPYPELNSNYYADIPGDVLSKALLQDPDDNMYQIAKQHFLNDFEYYSIKTKGLDNNWAPAGDVEPPAEASDRIIQMRMALAENYPIVFAIGEWKVTDSQDPNNTGKWSNLFSPVWDRNNYTEGDKPGGTDGYDLIMKDLDPGFFPLNSPSARLQLNYRKYGHVMLVIGSDAKNELFLVQNSYGLFDNKQKNLDHKPYFWIPYNYFRTKIVDATWVIRVKQQGPKPTPGPTPGGAVTVQFFDDFSGANVTKEVSVQPSGPNVLLLLLQDTNVGKQGNLTSFQIRNSPRNVSVSVWKGGKQLGVATRPGNDYTQFPRTTLEGTILNINWL